MFISSLHVDAICESPIFSSLTSNSEFRDSIEILQQSVDLRSVLTVTFAQFVTFLVVIGNLA